MLLGASNTTSNLGPLPVGLGFLGLPSCWLRVSTEATVPVAGAGGTATLDLAVPNVPALVGAFFHVQALVPDPLSGPVGFVLSDAATALIGS